MAHPASSIFEAFPAVIVPSFLNAVLKSGIFSLTYLLISSSSVSYLSFPIVTATYSSLNFFYSIDSLTLSYDVIEKSS